MKLKRIMAIVLCFAMVLSTMSFNVFAEEGVTETTDTVVAKVGNAEFTDIQEAIKEAAPSGTVTLLNDVTVDKWIMIAESLTISGDTLITLEIDGLTINGNGKTLTINSIESAGNGARLFYDATELNINNLTIKCAEAIGGGIGLKSGVISGVTFDGGTYGVMPQTGDVIIEDCTFKTDGSSIYFEEERDGLVVTGCTFENPDTANIILLRGDIEFINNTIISGRTVNVVSGSPVVTGNNFGDVRFKVYNDATATIEGNTINNLVFNDESEAKSTFTNNTLSETAQSALDAVSPTAPALAVASVNGVEYEDIQKAVDAACAESGDVTVTLLADVTDNVTLTEKVGLYLTIDGAGKTMNGSITFNALSDINDNRRITIKDINFVNNDDAKIDFISSVNTNHYPRVTVDGCSFTGSGDDGDVAVRLKSSHSVVIKDCTGTGLHSFLQNTSGWNLTIADVTVNDSKGGLALGTVQGVTISGCEIDVDTYGIRLDAQYNNNAVIESNNVSAFIPVVVRKAEADSNITINGENTMTASNEDGIWCAIGTSEYEENGNLPTASTGKINVTLNDETLDASGVYGKAWDGETIASVSDFIAFAKASQGGDSFSGKIVKLTSDIDFKGANFLEIAEDGTVVTDYRIPKFNGTFDGDGHTIKNFNFVVKNTGKHNIMMFSQDNMWAYIKNVNIENVTVDIADISGQTRVTALANRVNAGGMTDAAIKNVHVKNFKIVSNNVTSDDFRIGGLVYFAQGSQLIAKDCSITDFEVDVNKATLIGGAVAVVKSKCDFENVDVIDAVFSVDSFNKSGIIGGFVAQTQDKGTDTTFSGCDVTNMQMTLGYSPNNLGGFAGSIGSVCQFYNCTVTGSITSEDDTNDFSIGGFVGDLGWNGMFEPNVQHEFNECVTDVDITAVNANVGGFIGDSTVAGYPDRFMPSYFNCCDAKGNVKTENGVAGGFVGRGDRGIFKDCSASGNVEGRIAGGFWGELYPKAVAESTGGWSYQGKEVTHTDTNAKSIVLEELNVSGTVTGTEYAAELIGYMKDIYVNADGTNGYATPVVFTNNNTSECNRYPYMYTVATKEELNEVLATAKNGDTILFTADIDYGTDQLKIEKAITLDLGGFTLTTRNAYGGMSVKNNPTIKNGIIVHASNTAAIKVWNATSFEDLVIDVQGKGDANKTIGGIVLQSGTTTRVDSMKNVTIEGVALTNGIETYNCGDAAQDVIGSMENVTIDANGTGMLISAPCGTATNCDINGDKTGIEIWIKGNYSATLDLVNSNVTGGEQAVYAHDEFNTGVINSGELEFTVDDKTTFSGGTNGALLTVVNQHDSDLAVSDAVTEDAVAVTNGKYFDTLAKALTAANDGETVALIWEEGDAPIAMNGAVYGKTVTITGDATVDWSIGNLFVGRGGKGNGTVIFDNANLKSASDSSSYGIHVSGREKDTDNKYDGTLVINNSTIELDYLINKGTMALDNSTLTVKNGFSVGGRPASETESGVDTTATIDLKNGSKVVVNNHNGMGLGYEAIGVMNIDKTSAFECTQNFLITAKGTMNVNGGNVNVDGNLEVKGTLKSNGNVFGNIVAADTAVIELTGGLYTQDVTEWCADGYKCSATKDGKYMVYPDFTVEAIANVETAKAGDTITVQVKVTKGGNYTNADWVLKYDPRYVTYLGTDDKNYKISGKEYNGTPNDGYDEFDSDYALGTYTFTVNELTTEATAVFEIVDAHVHNYSMSIEFDGVEASKQNDIVAIKFKTADREIATKTFPYNGMEQRGNGVADAPANATITYSKTEDFTNGTQLPPAFVNVGTHTYYAQIKLDGYATKVVEGTLVIEAKGVEPSVEWMVAPESDKVEFIPVIKGVVDDSYKNKGGKVTVTGQKADGTAFTYEFDDMSKFAYDGHGKAVYTGAATELSGIKGNELLEVTVKYIAGTADNYANGENTASVYVNKSTINDTMEDKLATFIKGEGNVVYDGQTHYVTVDAAELAKLGWTATVATHNGVTYYGDVEVVDVTFTDTTGMYNDYTATVMIKTIRRNTVIYVNNATKKNGQADSEATGWGYTAVPVVIGTDLGEIKVVRADGKTDEVQGSYPITATYTPNDNYIVRVENGTLTIFDAVIKIEVVDNAHNGNEVKYGADTKSDYTAGSVANGNIATKMILVHTDADYAFFTYKGEKMYDVTDAGYSYVNHNYAEGTHVTEKKYQHVYAIVVDAEYGDVTSEVIKAKYASHLAYAGKDATAAYAPVKVTYDADINDKSNLHTNDYSTVKGVYGGIYSNSRYQISILKADYNKDKIVNTADAIDVKNAVIGE